MSKTNKNGVYNTKHFAATVSRCNQCSIIFRCPTKKHEKGQLKGKGSFDQGCVNWIYGIMIDTILYTNCML